MPQPICAAAIALSIFSTALIVLGFMSWWDVSLDATSMITIAMSTGFSVDLAIHITYAYVAMKKTESDKAKFVAFLDYDKNGKRNMVQFWPTR